jgi:hypothetical protein
MINTIAIQTGMPVNNDYLFQKQIEVMIDTSAKKLANEITTLKATVGKMSEEMDQLKKQVHELRCTPAPAPVSMRRREEPEPMLRDEQYEEAPQRVEQQRPRPSGPEGMRPRFGDYKSSDVSVEKVFYFGGKK